MGGGAAMRAAAKAAGAGILNSGLRGIVPDHPVSAAARKAARPVGVFTSSSSSSSTDAVKTSNSVGIDQDSVQKPSWEFDEWELAGGEEDFLGVSNDGMPRLVFGGAPSIEEAKEATAELKDVLDKAYLSSSPMSPSSPLSRRSQSEVLDTTACLTSQTVGVPAAPQHAMQAFRFLSESPAVQSVVASIASDANVWNAVLQNPALQDYLESQKISVSTVDQYEKESTGSDDILSPTSPRNGLFGFAESGESKSNNGLMDYLENIKLSVVEMMGNLADYFQNIFGGYSGEKEGKENAMPGFLDKALGPSLFGLAVMVILVVVLKRA